MPIPRSEPTRRLPAGRRRAAILALLEDAGGPLGVDELATALEVHPNTVRAHLGVLVRVGAATRSTLPSGGRGRPREVFTAAPLAPDGPAALAEVLADRLARLAPDVTAEAVAAGRTWADRFPEAHADTGPDAGRLDPVVEVLDRLGFEPEVADDAVLLRACPFRTVAEAHPDVVCNTHLGLIQRLLERSTPGVRASTIRPFVTPTLCIAEIISEAS